MNEKHIKILEALKTEAEKYSTQPQQVIEAITAAIEALKRAQPAEVKTGVEVIEGVEIEHGHTPRAEHNYPSCPNCGWDLESTDPAFDEMEFCPKCGQALKWQ